MLSQKNGIHFLKKLTSGIQTSSKVTSYNLSGRFLTNQLVEMNSKCARATHYKDKLQVELPGLICLATKAKLYNLQEHVEETATTSSKRFNKVNLTSMEKKIIKRHQFNSLNEQMLTLKMESLAKTQNREL